MKSIPARFALLGLALSIAGVVPTSFAQDSGTAASADNASAPQHRAPDPQKQATRLAKHLGLNDDQAAKITSILQSRQQQLASVRSDSSLSKPDRRAKLQSIQQDTDSQINALLTPDQQKQYAQMKQNMKNRWQTGRGAPNAANNSDSDGH
jgi:Spy/CpxP family protein refolding chaperone